MISPLVGGISRAIRRAVVLLPLPDSPTSETTSPARTLKETSWSACMLIGPEQAADREPLAEPA